MNPREHLAAERGEFLDLLRGLSASQWETPSLCEGWRVRDVVAHLLYDAMSLPALVGQALLAASPNRFNARIVDRWRGSDTSALVTAFDRLGDDGPLARWSPRLTLTDVLVHQQDVRRPLGVPRNIPPERLLLALTHPDPFTRPARRTKGLRLVATDVHWSRGTGLEVRGPGEALVMVLAGRPAALEDLDGGGLPILRDRMT